MEYAGPAPVGPFAALAAEMPLRKPSDVKQVEPGARPDNTAPDTGRDRDKGTEAAAARDIRALRRKMEQRDLPAGPPPTFEVNQLEMDADIQKVIARVEAARAQAREASALKLDTQAAALTAEAGAGAPAEVSAVAQPPRGHDAKPTWDHSKGATAGSSGTRPALDTRS